VIHGRWYESRHKVIIRENGDEETLGRIAGIMVGEEAGLKSRI
jgi:hypothetical protein